MSTIKIEKIDDLTERVTVGGNVYMLTLPQQAGRVTRRRQAQEEIMEPLFNDYQKYRGAMRPPVSRACPR